MSNLSQIKADSNWGDASNTINTNFQNMDVEVEKLKNSTTRFKGYFTNETNLKKKFPSPKRGDIAFVGEPYPGNVYDVLTDGSWHNTNKAPDTDSVNLNDYATKEDLEAVEDYAKKATAEYNVSVFHPTSGTSGTKRYDLAGAIAQVPEELRVAGVKVSFLNSVGKPESWKYQGGSWKVANFVKEADGGNKILTWVTDAATTRKQVTLSERKEGMQISYNHPDLGMICEQYVGANFSDTYWSADRNWDRILTELDYEKRGYSVIKEYIGLKEEGTLIGSNNSEVSVQYTDISNVDYIDAVVRAFLATQGGITFWRANKVKIITYLCNEGQYLDGNNFKFFLKKPAEASYISVGAYKASDEINYLKLIKAPTGKDILDLGSRISDNSNRIAELEPIKGDVELITVVEEDYTGLVDKNGYSVDSTHQFATESTIIIPIKECNVIEWCAKVFSPSSIAVKLYGKDHKTVIKNIIGTDGSKIEDSIYAGTIDLGSEEFLENKPYYVAIGCYLASEVTDRLYLKLLKKLPKDSITGIKEPIVNYMGAVRVNNAKDYFTSYWGAEANKWWYNIGNNIT